jgi:hypothetical protein
VLQTALAEKAAVIATLLTLPIAFHLARVDRAA